ncbi:hypothetical protein SAMN05421783_1513 [Thiocapsa roseopersicina]|uniref:Uncharacterized protein n=1 Tax=Thiocapsa roseopersicina TaxID=1058 RepID=A0A1H3DJN0_THIRO|nr:hypothetical protein SAMN05421783_1513 [Thiocapsa roseopersicina]
MGCSVVATCSAYGFDSGLLMIGGGMDTFTTLFAFPAYFKACDALVLVNMLDSPRRCGRRHRVGPTPYCDASLPGAPGANVVARWSRAGQGLELTNGAYWQDIGECNRIVRRYPAPENLKDPLCHGIGDVGAPSFKAVLPPEPFFYRRLGS